MEFIRRTWQNSWFLILPIIILGIFVIYILFLGVKLSHQDNERLSGLRVEKDLLNSTLQDLTLKSEATVCMGEELVIPSGHIDDLMPPFVRFTHSEKLIKTMNILGYKIIKTGYRNI